jgi:hypothetical protein
VTWDAPVLELFPTVLSGSMRRADVRVSFVQLLAEGDSASQYFVHYELPTNNDTITQSSAIVCGTPKVTFRFLAR